MIRGYISRNGKEGEVGGKLGQIVRISYLQWKNEKGTKVEECSHLLGFVQDENPRAR